MISPSNNATTPTAKSNRQGYAEVVQQEDEANTAAFPPPSSSPQQSSSLSLQLLLNSITNDERAQAAVLVVLALVSIRLLYTALELLGHLAVVLFVVVVAYKLWTRHQTQQRELQEDLQRQLRMERINREREESEQMVHEAARMMLDINRKHLEEYLPTHPTASYEEWIADLHPENVQQQEEGNDKSGKPVIDHRYYVEDSDHRILWNEMIAAQATEDHQGLPQREYVPASSSSSSLEP